MRDYPTHRRREPQHDTLAAIPNPHSFTERKGFHPDPPFPKRDATDYGCLSRTATKSGHSS